MRLGKMKRRRSGEEDRLFHYEIVQLWDNFIVECRHWDAGQNLATTAAVQHDRRNDNISIINKSKRI